jgi:hypothetical protein
MRYILEKQILYGKLGFEIFSILMLIEIFLGIIHCVIAGYTFSIKNSDSNYTNTITNTNTNTNISNLNYSHISDLNYTFIFDLNYTNTKFINCHPSILMNLITAAGITRLVHGGIYMWSLFGEQNDGFHKHYASIVNMITFFTVICHMLFPILSYFIYFQIDNVCYSLWPINVHAFWGIFMFNFGMFFVIVFIIIFSIICIFSYLVILIFKKYLISAKPQNRNRNLNVIRTLHNKTQSNENANEINNSNLVFSI